MIKKYLFLILSFSLSFIASILVRAQDITIDPGTYGTNTAGAVDESVVQGDGSGPGQNMTGASVNTFTGDAQAVATDFNYTRNGFPFKFERYFHNGITSPFGEMGQGWMSNYDICIFVPLPGTNGNHAILVMPNQSWTFTTLDGGNTFVAPPGSFYTLTNQNGTYVLTDKKGVFCKFQILANGSPNVAYLIEMDDLNGNKVTLNYETYTVYSENYVFNVQPLDGFQMCTDKSFIPPNGSESDQAIRLSSVSGPNNNWSINFTYYDNLSSPVVTSEEQDDIAYGNCPDAPDDFNVGVGTLTTSDYTYLNTYGSRLKSVSNSVGDSLSFDTGSQDGPITLVTRSPISLNADYQYYSYVNNSSPSGPTTIVTLKQVVDYLAPPGLKNLAYVSESDVTKTTNPVRQIKNGLGQVMYSYDYAADASGNSLTSTSGPNGLLQTDIYNSAGFETEERFVVDGKSYRQYFTLNSDFLPITVVDGNGNQSISNYDSLGNLTYSKDAAGNEQHFTFNGISRLTSSMDGNLNLKNYSYDANGNLLEVSQSAISEKNSYVFLSGSLIQKTTKDGNGHATIYKYDPDGNLIFIQEPNMGGQPGATKKMVYDNRNLLQSSLDSLNQKRQYFYNDRNLLSSVLYPDGTTESFQYDSHGNKVFYADKNSVQTTYSFDTDDRLTDVFAASNSSQPRHEQFQYDSLGNEIARIDGNGNKTTIILNE
ncbi:MAG TPA: DUF6531 domain-containing protein, partial [bacterium]|nr:DUF6531 domain-containing protein [bacterium]